MSLKKPLKNFFLLTFILAICLGFSATTATADPGLKYMPLSQLAFKYGLRHERDPVTGREVFTGNGYQMVVSAGMSSVLVNDELAFLDEAARMVKGNISVPVSNFIRIETMLKNEHENQLSLNSLKKIVLDPGHGGIFRGAMGRNGTTEKKVNLDISKKLKKLLEKKGIKVIMTRERDVNLAPNLNEDLQRRVDIANREQPDLFISIHANWCSSPNVRGFEIFYCKNKPVSNYRIKPDRIGQKDDSLDTETKKVLGYILRDEYKNETLDIAQEIKKSFKKLDTPNRGIKAARFKVIKKTECPSILVEVGFLSNKNSCRRLSDPSYRQKVAKKLFEAIMNYQKKMANNERFTK